MTVVGVPFYQNLGPHWTLTVLAGLSALLTPIPYIFYKWGPAIRKRSRFAANQPNEEEAKPVEIVPDPDSTGSSSLTIPIEREKNDEAREGQEPQLGGVKGEQTEQR
jgi:hypothetical protein